MSEKLLRQCIKESLLIEELTSSDRSEINQLIKKAIEKDRAQQRKLAKLEIEKELSSSKFLSDTEKNIRKELEKELKGKQLETAVLDITKKVIKKLYKELSYSYNPVIDRIKL